MRTLSRSGFALPLVLLTLVIATVGLLALFNLMGTDRRGVDNLSEQLRAFEMAQSGLEQYLARRESLTVWVADSGRWMKGVTMMPPARAESLRIAVPGGHADVVLQRLRAGVGQTRSLYVVRSKGVSTTARLRGSPQAERTLAQFAYWNTTPIKVLAAWTSLSGLQKNGTSGVLTGDDACSAQPPVAGVGVPNSPGYIGPTAPVSGNPPILTMGTVDQAVTTVGIDWNAIVNQDAVPADVTIPGGAWPSFADPNYWPVIRVNGDFTLPSAGRGILIVTGALTISGSDMWSGVVLVGGNIISNGNNTVDGGAISGLNVAFGASMPPSSLGNGNKTFEYNSCNIERAGRRFASLRPFPNAWMDNWSAY